MKQKQDLASIFHGVNHVKRKFGVKEVQAACWVWGNSLQKIIFHFPREKFLIKTKHGKTLSISNFCSDGRFNK